MKDVVLYAPEDWQDLQQFVTHLRDVQAVQIESLALATLTATPVHRVLLLMSIDLLHRLVCEAGYRALYRRLKLFEREGMIIVVYLRACHWQDSFKRSTVFPSAELAITTLAQDDREAIYQGFAAQL
jgi:hypothetical protein